MPTRITVRTVNPLTASGIMTQELFKNPAMHQKVTVICEQLGLPLLTAEELQEIIEDYYFEQKMMYSQVKEFVDGLDQAKLCHWDSY